MSKKNIRAIVVEYTQRIAANPQSRNLGEFLSVWPQIKELLDEGWTAKRIWAAVHEAGIVKIKYPTFISHIKKHTASTTTATTTITPSEEIQKARAAQPITPKPMPPSPVSSDKPKPASAWGKPIERDQNTAAGQIPRFGLDQSKDEYGKF